MKKILAILLAAMFVMSMSIMAFAAETATVKTQPTNNKFKVGAAIDLTGLVLTCGTKDVPYAKGDANFTIDPTTMAATTTSVTVKYLLKEDGQDDKEYTASIPVSLDTTPEVLTKLVVDKLPTKTTYKLGEELNPAGLVVSYTSGTDVKQVSYSDTTKSQFNFKGYDKTQKGDQTVTVTYSGSEATFTVKVVDPDGPTLTIAEYPNKRSYTVGDSVNAAGLVVTFKDGDNEEPVSYIGNESKIDIDPKELTKAGDQEIKVTYKGATAAFKVTVKEKKTASLKVHNAKSVYAVGEAFDYGSLAVAYIPAEGDNVQIVWYKDGNIGVSGFNSKVVADKVTITVTYKGLQATYDIAVKNLKNENETIVKDLWAAKNDLDNNPNATIGDYVEKYTSIISSYIAAENMDDIDRYIATADKGQELVQDSSLYPDNWNEFVKVYTDYLPTGVNQALDIAARLGWDASDQDFVQDIIDLVKGAAESDKAADNGTTANNGGSTTTTDANPKTGSTSAIAVFAVLSVAAAAAVVCTKKKED